MLFKVRGETPLERVVRVVAMLAVVGLVVWAYWQNNQRIVERLNRDKAVVDETDVLTKPQLDFIKEFRRGLKAEYGVDSRVRIFKDDEVKVPGNLGGRLFIGFSPKAGRLVLDMPPLVRRVLGEDYRASRERDWFAGRTGEADWPPRLRDLLIDIWTQLAGIGGEGDATQPPAAATGPDPGAPSGHISGDFSATPPPATPGAAADSPGGGEAVRAPVAAPAAPEQTPAIP